MNNFAFILERLSTRAKNALIAAQLVSEQMKHDHIGTEHLLFGIISEKSSFAAEVLLKNKINVSMVKEELAKVNQNHVAAAWKPILSENLKSAIERAAVVASRYQYQFIGTEHFLYGILDLQSNRAKVILSKLGCDMKNLKTNLISIFENIAQFPNLMDLSDSMAFHGMGAGGMGTGMESGPGMNIGAGMHSGNNIGAKSDPFQQGFGQANSREPGSMPEDRRGGPGLGMKSSALDYFTTDLTKKAAANKIDPVIGRKKEIERMVSILNRRTKNNPVLIGEPGVGKTAIVEGLALAIIKREVPDSLLDKKILALDLALIVAGSMFRGEFEMRLKQIIDEIRDNPKIIIFIDELHTVVGAGATTGSLDAANILKPALARGELRAIGATTLNEYKKHIEHDPALERRFQPIIVEEPTIEESIEILRGLRPNYEKHHKITITDEAIKAAVDLSSRYIQDRFLPDKALDLIDETAAYMKTVGVNSKTARNLRKLEQEFADLEQEKTKAVLQQDFVTADHLRLQGEKLFKQIYDLRKQIEQEENGKASVSDAEFSVNASGANTRNGENKSLSVREALNRDSLSKDTGSKEDAFYALKKDILKELSGYGGSDRIESAASKNDLGPYKQKVSYADIARTVSSITKIPLNKLVKTEISKLVNLEKILKEKIVGQDEAIKIIARSIRRSRAGVTSPKRPLGSFVFLGPTGVGKTETAKVLAREVFEDEDALIRVDMSEFMEKHNVARLIGAPAGYVGYEEGGRLTETVRRKPYAVILFDEMEKAHPDVFNILLQILEEGQLSDASGRKVNFRNTIVIMTSNIGLGELNKEANKIGFRDKDMVQKNPVKAEAEKAESEYERIKDQVLKSFKEQYRPEFINRIDKILVFRPLGYEQIREIASIQIKELAAHLKSSQQLKLEVTAEAVKLIADLSFDPSQGARLVRRNIQEYIEDPLAEKLISGAIKENSIVHVNLEKKKIVINPRQEKVRAV